MVLDLSSGGTFALPTPMQAGLYADLNPRDRFVREWIDRVAWFLSKRFTVRASIGAHLALEVRMELVGPEEVLRLGGVEWKARLVETVRVEEGGGGGGMVHTKAGAEEALPNHVVVQSVVPRQTAAVKEEKGQDTVVFKQESKEEPAEILASDTINLERDAESAPKFPCPKVFLHLVVREAGVPIPPRKDLADEESAWAALFRLAEWLFGWLASASGGEQRGGTAPIHITLERLYVGAVPGTALTMALPMAAMLLLGWLGVRPVLDALLPRPEKEGKEE